MVIPAFLITLSFAIIPLVYAEGNGSGDFGVQASPNASSFTLKSSN
jgi:hypothetical protein